MNFYSKASPYYTTEFTNGYLDIINLRDLPVENDDILFEVTNTYQYRPDLLAYDLYQDSKLWWVFAVRNKSILKDPIFDLTAGKKIYLPKLATINRSINL